MRYIYINALSCDGFRKKLCERLEEVFDIEEGFIYPRGGSGDEPNFYCEHLNYENSNLAYVIEDIEFENMGALPRFVLDGMLPYKSMIFSLMTRECNYNIYKMDFVEKTYYKILYYCYKMLYKNQIDVVVFGYMPHHAVDCCMYYLAKFLNVKTILYCNSYFEGRYMLASDMTQMGADVAKAYEKILNNSGEIILSEEMQKYYEEMRIITERSKKRPVKKWFTWYIRPVLLVGTFGRYIQTFFERDKDLRKYKKKHYKRTSLLRFKALFKSWSMVGQSYYNRLTQGVDINDKYIYFGLQMTPEETTMPMAGEFRNQILSVRLLAEAAAQVGIKVYVKEHWVQYQRDKNFYDELASIPNVYLVSTSVSASRLIKNSLAVSTQTGSCVVEGIANQKPSLVFGEACPYLGACGVYLIDSVDQCAELLNRILRNEIVVTERQSKAYFKAIEEKTLKIKVVDADGNSCSVAYDRDQSVEQLIEKIMETVNGEVLTC